MTSSQQYWSSTGRRAVVEVKSRTERRQCRHVWMSRINTRCDFRGMSWRNVCRICGACRR